MKERRKKQERTKKKRTKFMHKRVDGFLLFQNWMFIPKGALSVHNFPWGSALM